MSGDPLVSIVVPTFNRARFLPQTLDSLLEQDYRRLEVIVIDDGSSDETPAIVERYVARYGPARLRAQRQGNRGQARALNRGWSMARGELLGQIADDDLLLPGAIGQLVDALRDDPDVDAVHPDIRVIDEGGRPVDVLTPLPFSFRGALRLQETTTGVGALMRRSVFDRLGGWGPSLLLCPDWEFWLRLAAAGRIGRVHRVLACVRAHPGALSFSGRGLEMVAQRRRVLDRLHADPRTHPEIAGVSHEAYANHFVIAAILVVGEDVTERSRRFAVHDAMPARISREATRAQARTRSRLDLCVASARRQVEAQQRALAELGRAVGIRESAARELRAAIAERDERIARLERAVAREASVAVG